MGELTWRLFPDRHGDTLSLPSVSGQSSTVERPSPGEQMLLSCLAALCSALSHSAQAASWRTRGGCRVPSLCMKGCPLWVVRAGNPQKRLQSWCPGEWRGLLITHPVSPPHRDRGKGSPAVRWPEAAGGHGTCTSAEPSCAHPGRSHQCPGRRE